MTSPTSAAIAGFVHGCDLGAGVTALCAACCTAAVTPAAEMANTSPYETAERLMSADSFVRRRYFSAFF
jgi:hypothetical protein